MATPQIIISKPLKSTPGVDWSTVNPAEYPVQSIALTWSWGTEPSECNVVYTSGSPANLGSAIKLTLGNYFFSGVCEADVALDASRGRNRQLTFLDYRKWLKWDKCYGLFNQIDDRLVNGVRKRRYRHILPYNFNTLYNTWTDAPYSAASILQMALGGPGVETPWSVGYLNAEGALQQDAWHPNLGLPVYRVDCMAGKPLDTLLSEVGQECGLLFTHMPTADKLFNLVFAQKGVDGPAVTPPAASDDRQVGTRLSGNPTRVRVLGERNLYQVHDIALVADWNSNWNAFYDINVFTEFVFANFITWDAANDPEQIIARQEALSLALEMTLWDFNARMGGGYLDNRKYAGRCRNGMPCALYINQILFRTFTLPSNFWVRNTYGQALYKPSLEIADKLLAKVTYDPETGVTDYDTDPELNVDGNAFVLVKGYQVGKDMFEHIKPERFNLAAWNSAQDIWQKIEARIEDASDPDGMTIVFDEPVIRSSDLVTLTDGYATFNAAATISVPLVRATLTFAGEKFSWFQTDLGNPDDPPEDPVIGTQIHDDVLNVSGLNGEFIARNGLHEIPYADGKNCRYKAIEYANNFLKQQWVHADGRFHVPFTDATDYKLHGKIDRVTLNYAPEGKVVTVQLTNERDRINYVPERDLDRARQLATLFPGQEELRKQSDAARKIAATVRGSKDAYKLLSDAFHGSFTEGYNAKPAVVQPVVTAALPIGTPFAKTPNTVGTVEPNVGKIINTLPVPASHADDVSDTQFAGVSVRDGETINATTGAVMKLQSVGLALVRVMGPVAVNDSLQLAAGANYLVKLDTPATEDVIPVGESVGKARQAIGTAVVQLIRVHLAAAAGGGGEFSYRGDYVSTSAYAVNDIVRVKTGDWKGLWICVQAKPASAAAGLQPIYPEPTAAADRYWEMWAFGPQLFSTCVDGTKSVYMNSSDPF